MLSEKLITELKDIVLKRLNIEITDEDAKELGMFLVTYFGLLTGLDNE